LEPRQLLAAGSLDPTFGNGGIAAPAVVVSERAYAAALQSDGKIVTVGFRGTQVGLTRFNPDGTLDVTFGDGGRLTPDASFGTVSTGVTVAPDDSILALTGGAVVRFAPDGSSYRWFAPADFGNSFASLNAIVALPDGRVLVAGYAAVAVGEQFQRFAVARYLPDGTLDGSFGDRGCASFPVGFGAYVNDLAVQADGKVVLVGPVRTAATGALDLAFAAVRTNSDGTIDPTFGQNGSVVVDIAPLSEYANAVAIQGDGKVVIGGRTDYEIAPSRYLSHATLLRLNPDGTRDPNFGGGDGVALIEIDGYSSDSQDVALDGDGRILVAGANYPDVDFYLARLQPDGTPDPTFGEAGLVRTHVTDGYDVPYDMLFPGHGKVVLAGIAGPGGRFGIGLAQYVLESTPPTSTVMARHVFYNHSSFDGNDAGADARDDAAIATDKTALLPGQVATFANVTTFDRGLNGIMVDVRGLPAGDGPTPDDFDVAGDGTRVGAVSVRRGAGVAGSDRITLTWPDYNTPTDPPTLAVGNGWLTVTVKANGRTGLAAPDVFSFGNLIGEAGDGATTFRVSALDLATVKRALNSPTTVATPTDFNRDGRTNALDLATVKRSLGHSLAGFEGPAASFSVFASPRKDDSDTTSATQFLL
jgi:uncharacterized delta-60 repeat protein